MLHTKYGNPMQAHRSRRRDSDLIETDLMPCKCCSTNNTNIR